MEDSMEIWIPTNIDYLDGWASQRVKRYCKLVWKWFANVSKLWCSKWDSLSSTILTVSRCVRYVVKEAAGTLVIFLVILVPWLTSHFHLDPWSSIMMTWKFTSVCFESAIDRFVIIIRFFFYILKELKIESMCILSTLLIQNHDFFFFLFQLFGATDSSSEHLLSRVK